MTSTKMMATSKDPLAPLRNELQRAQAEIAARVPATIAKYLTPERVMRLVLSAAAKNKELLACTPTSILRCTMESVQLGLEPGGPLGHFYLVPFFNGQSKRLEAQAIVGYRGYIALARRSGEISDVAAYCVYQRDTFRIDLGTTPVIAHQPYLGADGRGDMVAAYAVAHFRGGGFHVDFMSRADIERIRMRSQTGRKGKGPWSTDYEEMAKKTVLRRAAKYWPLCVDVAAGLEIDARTDAIDGGSLEQSAVFFGDDAPASDEQTEQPAALPPAEEREPMPAPSKTDKVLAELRSRAGASTPQSNAEIEAEWDRIEASEKGGAA